MKVAVLIAALEGRNEYQPLLTSPRIIKKEEATWRQISILFIKEAKHLNRKPGINSQRGNNETARLAQASCKLNGNMPARKRKMQRDRRCYYCDRRGHQVKDCRARQRGEANKGHLREKSGTENKHFYNKQRSESQFKACSVGTRSSLIGQQKLA